MCIQNGTLNVFDLSHRLEVWSASAAYSAQQAALSILKASGRFHMNLTTQESCAMIG